VTVTGLGSLHADTFSVKRKLGLDASAAGLGTGDLFTLHLTGISLNLGGGNATLTISNGTSTSTRS